MSEDVSQLLDLKSGVLLPLHALRDRNARTHQVTPQPAQVTNTMFSSAAIYSAKVSTCPRSHRSLFSTLSRKASCVPSARKCKTNGRDARHLEGRCHPLRRQDRPSPCSAPSTKPSAAAKSRRYSNDIERHHARNHRSAPSTWSSPGSSKPTFVGLYRRCRRHARIRHPVRSRRVQLQARIRHA